MKIDWEARIPRPLMGPIQAALMLREQLADGLKNRYIQTGCEHLAQLGPNGILWATTGDRISCGGCAMKRLAFRENCDSCTGPFDDEDPREIMLVISDYHVQGIAQVCGGCLDTFGDFIALTMEEVRSA